jgi:hypothetical protein
MQQEIGVLHSNIMLLELQCESLLAGSQKDSELIDALKARCQAAEDANKELKAQLRPITRPRKSRGAHPAQSD